MKWTTLIIVCALAALLSAEQAESPQYLGKKMPAFQIKTLAGKTLTQESLKGKVTLIDFWATWCIPCRLAMPTIEKISKKYKAQGLQVIGADVQDDNVSKDVFAKTVKRIGVTYPIARKADNLFTKLDVPGLPTLILVDKTGTIRYYVSGFDEKEEAALTQKIEGLLKS